MATIKAIEGRSVHQIQSGQVIVDLTSVVKELVENSLDAGATKIDVRFKNHGIDSIEVQDDGNGINPEDFSTVALKHYTSKLSNFEDLERLETFGFRGEALSSLCALANVHVITARAQDGAVGKRLDFELSGKLKSTSVVAAPKGTTVAVENIFNGLPVRRKELEKHSKREWTKVLNFMYSYACIGINVRFSISNQPAKGKKNISFSTKGNPTTKENIANIFGAKTLAALVKLDLELELQSSGPKHTAGSSRIVHVEGHVSRPTFGEGRQTQDRQMYFVNSRPCLLPQISKVFNEVYKSFNHNQSPFVLANFIMDTNSYDVNVSPDKKTIMLHDQTALLEKLKSTLTTLFEGADHTLPQSALPVQKLPAYKPLTVSRNTSIEDDESMTEESGQSEQDRTIAAPTNLISGWAGRNNMIRPENGNTKATSRHQIRVIQGPQFAEPIEKDDSDDELLLEQSDAAVERASPKESRAGLLESPAGYPEHDTASTAYDEVFMRTPPKSTTSRPSNNCAPQSQHPRSSASTSQPRLQRRTQNSESEMQQAIPSIFNTLPKVSSGPINDAFARMRPRRTPEEMTEITIGDTTTTKVVGGWSNKRRRIHVSRTPDHGIEAGSSPPQSQGLHNFAAPGSRLALTAPASSHSIDVDGSDEEMDHSGEDATPVLFDQACKPAVEPATFDLDLLRERKGHCTQEVLAESSDESETEKQQRENDLVAQLIQKAEGQTSQRRAGGTQRLIMANGIVSRRKERTLNLMYTSKASVEQIRQATSRLSRASAIEQDWAKPSLTREETDGFDAETKLSLTVNKSDFERMRIVGQFNLGFILAVRPASDDSTKDELFIIDQHAADEKSNYERLQSTVVLQSQPLVQPKRLELTAVEEEVVTTHPEALKANGFEIDVAADDDVSRRSYRLLTLPTSHNTTFKLSDLEELMHLLSELSVESNEIPRPRKVQKMLAMRACRSSIMVGKTLTMKQMVRVVQHMGGMEKPWNCPHGRPTMRHLTSLSSWQGWQEGDAGQVGIWKRWLQRGHDI